MNFHLAEVNKKKNRKREQGQRERDDFPKEKRERDIS